MSGGIESLFKIAILLLKQDLYISLVDDIGVLIILYYNADNSCEVGVLVFCFLSWGDLFNPDLG